VMGKPFDERSDLYSAGVVYYEMLTGRVPFESQSDYALIRAQVEQQPPSLAECGVAVPEPLAEVLMKSLAKNPEDRYPNAAGMAQALREAKIQAEAGAPMMKETRLAPDARAGGVKETVFVAAPPVAGLTGPRVHLPRGVWIAAGAMLLAILALGALLVRNQAVAARHAREQAQMRAQQEAAQEAQLAQPAPVAPIQPKFIDQTPEQPPAQQPPVQQPRRRQQSSPNPVEHAPIATNPAPSPVANIEPPPPISAPASPAPSIPVNSAPVERVIPSGPPITSLREIQTLLVEKMPEGLDEFVRDEIRSQLKYRIEVVSSRDRADAIMRCDLEKVEGGNKVGNATGHVFGVKGHESATVRIYDRSGRRLLWEEEVTDKRGIMGIHGGENKLAGRIVGKLKKQLR
jgi:type II secretory pathway pseudopilin PulG